MLKMNWIWYLDAEKDGDLWRNRSKYQNQSEQETNGNNLSTVNLIVIISLQLKQFNWNQTDTKFQIKTKNSSFTVQKPALHPMAQTLYVILLTKLEVNHETDFFFFPLCNCSHYFSSCYCHQFLLHFQIDWFRLSLINFTNIRHRYLQLLLRRK